MAVIGFNKPNNLVHLVINYGARENVVGKPRIAADIAVVGIAIAGERGFRKTKKSRSTPRARFEALSVGIALALKENPNLKAKDVSKWLESDEFNNNTKSDAANNKNRLINRIVYVRDMLLR